ncbi:CheB methylesterase domain-containing protein [Porticoccus sp. W117]|uniref:CheB methylesterase domain-containing protein n=1 Tax=Porticoccus sp. W117 TaxID=3054777 RepID=UPI00259267CC|nr:CheB methylesterase domain-containing protein [Porticoccus sp. W117]MDM3870191.1 CheB methylesterase domain-containing protein [Porticoccus sp. W117]
MATEKQSLVAVGASTGGTKALATLLAQLPGQLAQYGLPVEPIIAVTQHIDSGFARALADSLNKAGSLQVSLAENGEQMESGRVYLAPGDSHLLVDCCDGNYFCRLGDGPPRDKCKPSVDALFESLAAHSLDQVIGVLLTGMGKDGAKGLLAMHQQGAYTVAQDEDSSVIWGMPGEAVRLGAVNDVVAIDEMAEKIASVLATRK